MTAPRLLLVAALVLWPCGCGARQQRAVVFASASLTAPFEALGMELERRHPGAGVDFHFAGTGQLVAQLRAGAVADVLASADSTSMEEVVQAGRAGTPRVFARNRMTIVTQLGNPAGIRTLADLGRTGLRVALCGPEVPAGRYARQALAKASVTVHSVSDEPSVKAVVAKVRLGEIDAGIVYVTDVASRDIGVASVAIPDEHNVVATYLIATLSEGAHRAAGAQFLAFVLGAEGQETLRSFGFTSP